jgi:predicted lipoprotein with Yx(FWY)xxD motif
VNKRWTWAAAAAVTVLSVSACGSSYSNGNSGSAGSSGSSSASTATANAVLATADSDLGTIVVDGKGLTVYVFDKDTAGSGQSACSGECLDKWPAVTADSPDPAVDGVTGDVATITRDDGTMQVTLNGLPLYLYAGDAQKGDVTGQGVGQVWWVVAPDGAKITAAPGATGSGATGSGATGSGY